MRRIFLSILSLFVFVCSVFSQFDVQFSQYMFHQNAFNPAAVGEGEMIQVAGQHRLQWIGIPNAGRTTVFSIHSPLKIDKKFYGIGFKFLNEKIGQFVNQNAHLQLAVKRKLGAGILSLGTDFGFVSIGFNGGSDSIRKISLGDYHDLSGEDPLIPKTIVAGMSFDMTVGAYYSTPSFYTGLSLSHINNPTVEWSDILDFTPSSTLFFTSGYNYSFLNPKYVLKSSTLFKTDFSTLQFDIGSRLEFDNKYWGGISYRIQDAVVFLAGINIEGGLSIGYSYDLPTSQIITVSSGSHEILLVYSFEYVFGKRTNKYKSIRVL